MDLNVIFAVLRELGVLFEAPDASNAEPGPAVAAGAAHGFFEHAPLWEYEAPEYARPFADAEAKPLYQTLPAGTTVAEALAQTRLVVFLGAAQTPELLRALDAPGCLTLVFEQDPGRVAALARALGTQKLAGRAHIFLGPLDAFLPPLSRVLPAALFQAGFPVFFALPGFAATWPQETTAVVRLLETLFFQHLVYPLSGQSNSRGLPLRPMTRGLFFDQQLHAFANASAMALAPDISGLRRAFPGETAILVAAGPDLPERLEYLRRQRDKAVLIAVNNALKPLLAAGIRPHFVVANDTSTHTARSWEGLPRLADVALVAHCLTDLGAEVFPTRLLFGNYRPEVFGTRPNLRLHGSVITTAYSLARHLGCARCVLVGVQLCSGDPWSLTYARGTIHEADPARAAEARPLTQRFPQLVPVTNPFGRTLYTSLNFLDASLWLLDEIRSMGLACVNLTQESLVHGPGVEYDPDFEVPATDSLARRLRQVFALRARPKALEPIRQVLAVELNGWRSIAAHSARLAQGAGPEFAQQGLQTLAQFDQTNVSYLVQRFEDFDNRGFHTAVFDCEQWGGAATREGGLRYYFGYVARMAGQFAEVLAGQLELLARQG